MIQTATTPSDRIASKRRTEPSMQDSFNDEQAAQVIDAAQQMIDIWLRLSPEKQAALLQRFGTQENALAALVATHLVAQPQA